MKKIFILAAALLLIFAGLFAGAPSYEAANSLQEFQSKGKVRVVDNGNEQGPPSFVAGTLSEKQVKADGQTAKKFLGSHKDFFKMNQPEKNLKEVRTAEDDLGMTHVRLQQTKNGIPVDRNELNVHFNEENVVTTVNGSYDVKVDSLDIKTTPSIQADKAVAKAKTAVKAPADVPVESSELIIYPLEEEYYLAYRVNLEFFEGEPGNWFVYVDAQNGKVLDKFNAVTGLGFFDDILESNAVEGSSALSSVQGKTASESHHPGKLTAARGSGLGTIGITKLLNLSRTTIPKPGEGPRFYLADYTTRQMDGIFTYNMKNTANQIWLYSNSSASWKDVEYSGDSSSWEKVGQGPAVDAHSNSRIVYDYFLDKHDRNSLDDNGMAIRSRVHYGTAYNNAFWSNGIEMMTYGDGDGKQFIPLAALDVTAHEMVHGITHYNGGLRYRFETGAINEAFSDTFATIVDDSNWDVGEDIMGSEWLANGRTALRSNEDPGKFPTGAVYWPYSIDGEGRYPAHMDEYYYLPGNMDNGGVHINCTILQHSAYLVAEKYGMGRTVVADTWYRSYDYLHYDASFAEFREAILQSAIDLYGEGSEEHNAFLAGFEDVGLYEGWSVEDNPRAPKF
ncbi:peptidase M4 family protein [Jeotgalibacillus sp. S-D1]|uniref:M4 family metallopeptidase n=1 Tax=Jeotgalibacillus sp. S-D1 TaxID=2552189 RepID=UPI00105A0EFD|nr:M4 family metallopeptidase [Jeotgalibacillus sp. S-D1]TDL34220.1 peptidase M4 family protein [Jeotgalibacillus sp. S-D1]